MNCNNDIRQPWCSINTGLYSYFMAKPEDKEGKSHSFAISVSSQIHASWTTFNQCLTSPLS